VRSIAGLWTWRRNPLCRRTDLAEAWLALWGLALLLLGVPLAGLAGGMTAYGELAALVREERAQRHPVWATAKQRVHRPPAAPGEAHADEGPESYPVLAFWNGPDGVTHTGTVHARRPLDPGDRFRVWTDPEGRLTPPPLGHGTAVTYAVAAGLVTGALTGVAVEAARRAAVGRLLRRRYTAWEDEWARIGPDWGRADSNS
jgi:hypothetical protein